MECPTPILAVSVPNQVKRHVKRAATRARPESPEALEGLAFPLRVLSSPLLVFLVGFNNLRFHLTHSSCVNAGVDRRRGSPWALSPG